MARTDVLTSATTQFFINVVDNSYLDTQDGGYAAFGRVISDMNTTVQSIRTVAVQSPSSSQPITPPVIHWAYQLK
jgi:cyclophilin family peptidyl-prolyl cis-trans isomerase